MKKVINTGDYGVGEGFAIQITLPSGKYYYTGVGSLIAEKAKEKGLECKTVNFYGACIFSNINYLAHEKFPIQIDEVSVVDFIDKIATAEEGRSFFE